MTSSIAGLLFDKDGTLFDFQSTWGPWARQVFLDVARGDAAKAGELAAGLGYDFANQTFTRDSVIIAGTPDEVAVALLAVAPDWEERDLLGHLNDVAASIPQVEPVPLIPLLTGFRAAGLRLGVATNDAEAPARAHLATADILHLFDFVAGYDSGFGAKPATGMQVEFCTKAGLAPEQVAMVGDSTHDLRAGRAAGMTTIGVLTGMAGKEELAPFADVILDNIGGIPAWLD